MYNCAPINTLLGYTPVALLTHKEVWYHGNKHCEETGIIYVYSTRPLKEEITGSVYGILNMDLCISQPTGQYSLLRFFKNDKRNANAKDPLKISDDVSKASY